MIHGCDTFIVLPPLTAHGGIIFGKNSDRPSDEVQEVIYEPSNNFENGGKVKCTFIEIDQASSTKAVLLSKPAWMWGAEMGANDCGVVIGNEAVYTLVNQENISEKRLLGMDLVRLGLERASTADEAVSIITKLLETHGQGGPCSNSIADFYYHNSFLIADPNEAYVLETAGRLWAVEKVTEGHRNISNCLSITTNICRMSDNLKSYAIDNNLWDGQGELNFSAIFSSGGSCDREKNGRELLNNLTADKKFNVQRMFKILRDKESGICMPMNESFTSTGSQVSVLSPPGSGKPHCHWVTATPDPSLSVFKPFIFTPSVKISQYTISPKTEDDSPEADRTHNLYRLHKAAVINRINVLSQLQTMEQSCVEDVEKFITNFEPGQSLVEFDELLKDIVETEVKFYKKANKKTL
uniref:Secernin-2 n=2 Tax=Clastoptera arizonana TaxID=38151 RepID=A0A1B6CC42_9HEMI